MIRYTDKAVKIRYTDSEGVNRAVMAHGPYAGGSAQHDDSIHTQTWWYKSRNQETVLMKQTLTPIKLFGNETTTVCKPD